MKASLSLIFFLLLWSIETRAQLIQLPQVCELLSDCDPPGPCSLDVLCVGDLCVYVIAEDGSSCEPLDWCQTTGVCMSGQCVPSSIRDCSEFDGYCSVGECDSELEECYPSFYEYGTSCYGSSGPSGPCVDDHICDGSGVCEPVYKPFGVLCDEDVSSCEMPGICSGSEAQCEYPGYLPDGSACDDGLFCTVEETCLEGDCQGGIARDCSHIDDTCNEGICDDDYDECMLSPFEEGTECVSDQFYGICLDTEICNGEGTCVQIFKEAGVLCRQGDGTDCNLDEVCTGDSSFCPIDIIDQSPCCRNRPYNCHPDDHDCGEYHEHHHVHDDDDDVDVNIDVDDHDSHHSWIWDWWPLFVVLGLVILLALAWFLSTGKRYRKRRRYSRYEQPPQQQYTEETTSFDLSLDR